MVQDNGRESDDDGDEEGDVVLPFKVFVLFEAGLSPLALGLGWALGLPPLAGFAWDARAALTGVAAALPMLMVFALAMRWPVGPFEQLRTFFDRELAPLFDRCEWPDLALISVAAGLGEELLFRGVVQAWLVRAVGPVAGVAVAGLVFGLLHPISVTYVVLAGMLGAYLGAVWLYTDNLLTVIVAHALYDFIALLVLLWDRRVGEGIDGD